MWPFTGLARKRRLERVRKRRLIKTRDREIRRDIVRLEDLREKETDAWWRLRMTNEIGCLRMKLTLFRQCFSEELS